MSHFVMQFQDREAAREAAKETERLRREGEHTARSAKADSNLAILNGIAGPFMQRECDALQEARFYIDYKAFTIPSSAKACISLQLVPVPEEAPDQVAPGGGYVNLYEVSITVQEDEPCILKASAPRQDRLLERTTPKEQLSGEIVEAFLRDAAKAIHEASDKRLAEYARLYPQPITSCATS